MAELRRYNPKTQRWEPLLGGGGGANTDIVAPAYDSVSTSYSINDLVIENNKLYSAKEPIAAPAGQFNPSKWNETDIASAKADLINGKVPASQLPSYVDDVIEISQYPLPVEGESGKIYVVLSDNKVYRWSGSSYIEIAAEEVVTVVRTGEAPNYAPNYSVPELKEFLAEERVLIFRDSVLKKISSTETSIVFQYVDPQDSGLYNFGVFTNSGVSSTTLSKVKTYASEADLNAKAANSQTIDGTTKTVNEWIGSKIDEPANEGTSGQVLMTDGDGGRAWGSVLPSATTDGKVMTVVDSAWAEADPVLATVEDNTTLVVKEGTDLTLFNAYGHNNIVKIKENRNGVIGYYDYIPVDIVKVSNSDEYAVILIRKYVTDKGDFGSLASYFSYLNSNIENWCENTYKNYFSTYLKGQMRNITSSIGIKYGSSNSLTSSVFMPSSYHMGGPDNNDGIEGSYSKWFNSDESRKAYLESNQSTAVQYWISAYYSDNGITGQHKTISANGSFSYASDDSEQYYRPIVAIASQTPIVRLNDENESNGIYALEYSDYLSGNTVEIIREGNSFYKIKDSKARADIAGIKNGQTLNSFGEVEAELDTLITVKDGTDLVVNGSDEGGSGGTNTPLKDFAIGSTIQIKESGTFVNFKLVEKETIDGNIVVTLLKETATDSGSIGTSTIVTYDNSTSDNWCQNTYYNRLTEYVQGYTVSKPIKCRTKTMVSTINRKCFLPSAYELGIGTYIDGNSIWFSNDTQRNTGAAYWTRTYRAYESGYNCYYYVTATGASDTTTGAGTYYMNYGYRPCLAFSGDTPVNTSNQIDEGSITYTDTVDKIQEGNDYYKLADQDVRAMLAAPSAQGTYTLKCEVNAQGEPTISWVLDT